MVDVGQEGHHAHRDKSRARGFLSKKHLRNAFHFGIPPLKSPTVTCQYFLWVGGVGLNFNAPLAGTDTNVTDHKALGKRIRKEVVSSLLSTPVPQICLKSPRVLKFFRVFSGFL